MAKKIISALEALQTIKSGLPLKDVHVEEALSINSPDDDWHTEIYIENCVLDDFHFPCLQATKPVSFINTHFKYTESYAPYFMAGLLIRSCTLDTYLDFQSGGHNKNGTEIRIENNVFKGFVNFFDDWFEGPVIVEGNTFEQDTNLLSQKLLIKFDVPPISSGNTGKMDVEDEKWELKT